MRGTAIRLHQCCYYSVSDGVWAACVEKVARALKTSAKHTRETRQDGLRLSPQNTKSEAWSPRGTICIPKNPPPRLLERTRALGSVELSAAEDSREPTVTTGRGASGTRQTFREQPERKDAVSDARAHKARPRSARAAMETKLAETKLRVAIRVRPLRSEEGACAWRIEGENVYQADCEEVVGRTAFRYDAVYGENSATKDVYEGVCRELVDGALRGVNGTIFAYGQTSSGKTFTMQGGDKYGAGAPGLMHLAADHIFSVIEARSDTDLLTRCPISRCATSNSATYWPRTARGSPHARTPRDRRLCGGRAGDGRDAAPRHGRGVGPGREAAGRRRDGHERKIVEVAHGLSHRRRVAAARVRRGPRRAGGGDFFGGPGRLGIRKIDGRDGRAPEGGRQDQPVSVDAVALAVQQLGEKGKENFVNFRDSA